MIENTKQISQRYPPRYVDIEKKYQSEYVVKELEDKKRKLSEIRELHKPIDHEEIVKHKKKYDKIVSQMLSEKEKIRIEERQRLSLIGEDLGRLKSSFLESVLSQDQLSKSKDFVRIIEIKEAREKV